MQKNEAVQKDSTAQNEAVQNDAVRRNAAVQNEAVQKNEAVQRNAAGQNESHRTESHRNESHRTESRQTDSGVRSRPAPEGRRRRSLRWRVVDIVVASVVGVAAALVFFAWNALHSPITGPIEAGLPGAQALLYGVWLFAGVLGGLIIRKPGAALYTELVAAAVSALLGNEWGGFLTIESGLVQGLGAELVFLVFLYSYWRMPVAILAGAGAGLAMAVNDNILWNIGATVAFQLIYTACAVVSGAVIAGLGSWFIVRGLARTGVLSRFAAGREAPIDDAVAA